MTSLRSHIADVLRHVDNDAPYEVQADALLADPTLAAIIDHAADWADAKTQWHPVSPEVRALLAAWRASRAEQEPER